MTREEVLEAFAQMSTEDQEAIREALTVSGAASSGPEAMKHHMTEMMAKMRGSEDPMACCRDMMGMCQQMMNRLAGEKDAT